MLFLLKSGDFQQNVFWIFYVIMYLHHKFFLRPSFWKLMTLNNQSKQVLHNNNNSLYNLFLLKKLLIINSFHSIFDLPLLIVDEILTNINL